MTKEENLESAELERERLNSLVNSMADAVIATDEEANIVIYNGAALNILDTNKSLTSIPIENAINLVDKNNQEVDVKSLIIKTQNQKTSRDYRIKYPNNSHINVYLSIAPVKLGYGQKNNQQGFVILLRDITREKSLEEERDEFISVVSHELRTPIAIAEGEVGNATFLIEKMNGDKKILKSLKQAHAQILFLSSMINDLATLSRAERNKLNVDTEKINAFDLVFELQSAYKNQAKEKGLDIKINVDPKLESLNSSRLYVREILQNFLTNSLKYTEKGSVTISASKSDRGVKFEITDTGIGISKPDQEKVFDKFFRSEDFRTRASSGTGLGLYVTMKLARIINADISLESELNEGSTFIVDFPNLD